MNAEPPVWCYDAKHSTAPSHKNTLPCAITTCHTYVSITLNSLQVSIPGLPVPQCPIIQLGGERLSALYVKGWKALVIKGILLVYNPVYRMSN